MLHRRLACLLLVLSWGVGCIAEEHDPESTQVPGDPEREDEDWAADQVIDAERSTFAGTAPPGPALRSDPRRLPRLGELELEASLDLVAQELGAGLDDLVHAELLLRQAELLLARDAEGDAARARAILVELVREPEYRHFPRLDTATFLLAHESGRAGDSQGLKEASMLLIRNFPSSEWVVEAYVVFGDHYFEEGNVDAAAKFYQKVAEGWPKTDAAIYSSYRLGWCELQVDPARSLERFVRTIKLSMERHSHDAVALRSAARRDLTHAYARVGRPARAWPFFVKFGRGPQGEDHSVEMMRTLVDRYRELGELGSAGRICDDLRRHAAPGGVCQGL